MGLSILLTWPLVVVQMMIQKERWGHRKKITLRPRILRVYVYQSIRSFSEYTRDDMKTGERFKKAGIVACCEVCSPFSMDIHLCVLFLPMLPMCS